MSISAVESYLAKSMAGQLGVTGEGTLLENAEGTQTILMLSALELAE